MKVYLICPCNKIAPDQKVEIDQYIAGLLAEGCHVHSYKDADQSCPTGVGIYARHIEALRECDEVHIFWDTTSTGSHVDLGMAIALQKPLKLIKYYQKDKLGKSFLKIIKKVEKYGYDRAFNTGEI